MLAVEPPGPNCAGGGVSLQTGSGPVVYVCDGAPGPDGQSVVISAEPGELSVVNVVGPIDFSELGALGGVFGIPRTPVTPR